MPRDQAFLIESRKTVKRFMEVVELTDEELAAVQDDYDKLEEAVERTQSLQAPTTLILTFGEQMSLCKNRQMISLL